MLQQNVQAEFSRPRESWIFESLIVEARRALPFTFARHPKHSDGWVGAFAAKRRPKIVLPALGSAQPHDLFDVPVAVAGVRPQQICERNFSVCKVNPVRCQADSGTFSSSALQR